MEGLSSSEEVKSLEGSPPPQMTPGKNVEMVHFDPVSGAITKFPPGLELNWRDPWTPPKHPQNLFFRVEGKITMPVLSLEELQTLKKMKDMEELESSPSGEEEEVESFEEEEEIEEEVEVDSSEEEEAEEEEEEETSNEEEESEEEESEEEASPPPIKKRRELVPCPQCGVFFLRCNLPIHLRAHADLRERHFSCRFCPNAYLHQHSLVHHLIFKHCKKDSGSTGAYLLECVYCPGKMFGNEGSLHKHLVHQHLQREPSKALDSPPQLQETTPVPLIKEEPLTEQETPTSSKIILTTPPSPPKPSFQEICKYCERTFSTRALLHQHILTDHQDLFFCSICQLGFNEKYELFDHLIRIHGRFVEGDKITIKCPFCTPPRIFPLETLLQKHIRLGHQITTNFVKLIN